jgi:exopolyphosphatase
MTVLFRVALRSSQFVSVAAMSLSAAASPSSLQDVLSRGRAALSSKQWPAVVRAVTGNEAADADSIVSSLCLSLYHAHKSKAGDAELQLPVMPIPRADLALRRETVVLLSKSNIDLKDMIFSDEVDLQQLQTQGKLQLTLVDHNAVTTDRAALAPSVVEIVDHHADQGKHPSVTGAAREVAFSDGAHGAALVGSCCTLVAERFLKDAKPALTPEVALLLMGVIALDTVNLDPAAKRATQRDHDAAAALEHLSPDTDRSGLYKALSDAKFDPHFWHCLSAADCLRHDYKQFSADSSGTFGVSSVLMKLDQFLAKEGSADAMAALMQAKDLKLLAVLSFMTNPKPHRQLLLYHSSDSSAVDAAAQYLQQEAEHLELHETDGISSSESSNGSGSTNGDCAAAAGVLRLFEQGNIAASRKQVAPALMEYFSAKL